MFELSQSDTSVIDCLELTLLAENRTICLSHLKLATVPPILEKLPDLLAWYSLFEKLDASISDFTVLELSNNSITCKLMTRKGRYKRLTGSRRLTRLDSVQDARSD